MQKNDASMQMHILNMHCIHALPGAVYFRLNKYVNTYMRVR